MAAASCQNRLGLYCEGLRIIMATSPHASSRLFVGVDIAARSFVAVWGTSPDALQRAHTFAQTPDGFASFQQHLQATAIAPMETLVVMEATGSYWVALA